MKLVDSAQVTAERAEATLGPPPACFLPGRVLHCVTGDPAAFAHTARVIGGVDGEIVPLPLTELPAGEEIGVKAHAKRE